MPVVGAWPRRVLSDYFQYHAVPTSLLRQSVALGDVRCSAEAKGASSNLRQEAHAVTLYARICARAISDGRPYRDRSHNRLGFDKLCSINSQSAERRIGQRRDETRAPLQGRIGATPADAATSVCLNAANPWGHWEDPPFRERLDPIEKLLSNCRKSPYRRRLDQQRQSPVSSVALPIPTALELRKAID